jgi:hypothetical protein
VFVLVIAGLLGWFVRGVNTQRDAVKCITKASGGVYYSYQRDPRSGYSDWRRQPRCPRWLLELIGIDCLYSVEGVRLSVRSKDTALRDVANLTRLRTLSLDSSRDEADGVADIEMINFGRLTALETLAVYDLPLTDAALVNLKGLSHLKALHLSRTKITDAGLMHLRDLPSLQDLNVANTHVSDRSIRALREMGALKRLDVSSTLFSFPASVELSHAIPGTEIYNEPLRWGPGLPDDGSGNPAP